MIQIHTTPLYLSHTLTALSSSSGQEKGFDFLFNLGWDGFQNSLFPLPLSLSVSHTISPLVSSTPVSAPQMCSLCGVHLFETTTPSPSSCPGWAKTIRQHLSRAQASCTAHYLHSHSNTQKKQNRILFCSLQTHNGSKCWIHPLESGYSSFSLRFELLSFISLCSSLGCFDHTFTKDAVSPNKRGILWQLQCLSLLSSQSLIYC